MSNLEQALQQFTNDHPFRNKGALSIALVVTDFAREQGLPLDPDDLLTARGGQVRGTGKSAVQAILERHGITRLLASEGGRTSRGSIENMRHYVAFLNDLAHRGDVDLETVERFWIERVREFFGSKPFRLKLDAARSLHAAVGDIIDQAVERQEEMPGVMYAGAVIQHLVGAKLDCVIGAGSVTHHCVSTADAPGGRAGDFFLGDVAIHVTTAPSESVIQRCRDNLDHGHRPLLVTLQRSLALAYGLAENGGIRDRLDIFDVEQFLAANLYEHGKFTAGGRRTTLEEIVRRYNEIIDEVETDPSLKIALGG